MGFVIIHTNCAACGAFIGVNPNRCPSIRVDGGEKQPICEGCFKRWNEIHRVSKGLEPVSLDPEAYSPEPEGNVR